ncbi:hypothetical protein DMENIID0001_087760 [Sergentomyia squamirostris]
MATELASSSMGLMKEGQIAALKRRRTTFQSAGREVNVRPKEFRASPTPSHKRRKIQCYYCKQMGNHYARNCPLNPEAKRKPGMTSVNQAKEDDISEDEEMPGMLSAMFLNSVMNENEKEVDLVPYMPERDRRPLRNLSSVEREVGRSGRMRSSFPNANAVESLRMGIMQGIWSFTVQQQNQGRARADDSANIHNNTPSSVTGMAPNQLMMGYVPRTLMTTLGSKLSSAISTDVIRKRPVKVQVRLQRKEELAVGQEVLYFQSLGSHWTRAKVVARLSTSVYRIRLGGRELKAHRDQLKPWVRRIWIQTESRSQAPAGQGSRNNFCTPLPQGVIAENQRRRRRRAWEGETPVGVRRSERIRKQLEFD